MKRTPADRNTMANDDNQGVHSGFVCFAFFSSFRLQTVVVGIATIYDGSTRLLETCSSAPLLLLLLRRGTIVSRRELFASDIIFP